MRIGSSLSDGRAARAALREAAPLGGLAALVAGVRPERPGIAAAGLLLAAAVPLAPLLPLRLRRGGALAPAAAALAWSVALVSLNGSAGSPLFPFWLAITAGTLLASPASGASVAAASLAAAAVPAFGQADARTLATLAAAAITCALCLAAARGHARSLAVLGQRLQTDHLTGVRNRLALDGALDSFLGRGRPRGALVFIDLDGFREVNRTRGHAAADELLRAVGAALRATLPHDFVARAGGDEFVLLLDRRRDPLAVAKHVIGVIANSGPAGLRLSATAGVAYVPEDGVRPDEVRSAADQALRWGKADGKARALRYDRHRAAASPEVGEEEIRRLWSEDRITIQVQPIVDLRLGRVRGHEALVRFNVDGDNSPLRWFALADRLGLRPQLELACLCKALSLYDARPAGTHLSVNLSPDLLELPEVHATLGAMAELSGLVLELTEDAVIEDYERLGRLLAPHLERGLRIAVDDFGSGRANLRHAWSILPRYLKLDRTLVTRIDADDARRALVGSIVAYADQVGATLVAEGVETTAELNTLRQLGVPYAQGFRLAPPGPPWPAIDLDALLGAELPLSTPSRDPELLIASSTETAGSLQKRFGASPSATTAVVQDPDGCVLGLLTRNRLLVTLGVRFGFALHGDRPALAIADRDFVVAAAGAAPEGIVARAMARDETRRYDPILVLDENGRLLGKLTIQELLESRIQGAEGDSRGERGRLAAVPPQPAEELTRPGLAAPA